VFEKHCVSCHDFGEQAGEKINLAGDRGTVFCTSYAELRGKGWINVPGAGPFKTLMPKSWGSHASRFVNVLLDGHGDEEIDRQVKLDGESFDRIVTWIDLNAPYYPSYASAYRNNPYGRSPLNGGQLKRLAELTGAKTDGRSTAISFTRPELSPALAKFKNKKDPGYKEALALIEAGRSILDQRPRADMPGFELVDQIEIEQEAKYQARLQLETAMRQAIANGQRHYESADARP
jgi:hypothetical protein